MSTSRESRAHHYVPQCWLAGFTNSGEKEGMLYVTDLKRKKQWKCKPSEAGHRRDFNRIEDPKLADPVVIEKIFSNVETTLAPVLKQLDEQKRGPKDSNERGILATSDSTHSIWLPNALMSGWSLRKLECLIHPRTFPAAMVTDTP